MRKRVRCVECRGPEITLHYEQGCLIFIFKAPELFSASLNLQQSPARPHLP